MAEIYENSDRLNSPVEAFYCSTENLHLPVAAHWHYFMEILYLLEGSVMVVCNGITYHMEAGELLLIPPQAVHSISGDKKNPFRYTCVKYSVSHIRPVEGYLPNLHILLHNLMLEKDPPLLFGPGTFTGFALKDCLDEIVREVHEKQYGYLTLIFSRLTDLMLRILRIWYRRGISLQTDPRTDADTYSVHDVVMYIDWHSGENLKVDELAKLCNMSYSYFARVFHRQYGQSCKQYIEFIRLTKAENLLLFTNHDLSAIAAETGFSDSSHLIRCFRRLYHITPKQYRLQHAAEA